MSHSTTYQWVLEVIEDGDVIDIEHFDSLKEITIPTEHDWVIALVRRTHNQVDGDLLAKLYAYVDGNELPEFFDDESVRVPKRYQVEFSKSVFAKTV